MCHTALFEINVPSYSIHTIWFEIAGPCKNQQSLQSLVHKHNNKSSQWKWCQISPKWHYHALLFCLGLFLTDWSNREMINSLVVLNFYKGSKPCLSFSAISCVPIKIFSVFTSPWNIHLWSGYSSFSCAMIIGIRDPYHARYNGRTEHKLWRFVLQHVPCMTSTRIITITDVNWTLTGITMHASLALRRACNLTCWHFD